MTSFWQEIRSKVVSHTTSADVADKVYKKLASTHVQGPALIRPAFLLGQLSVLTMDYISHVEHFLQGDAKDWSGMLRTVCFMRECAHGTRRYILEAGEPLERVITMLEEILEGEEVDLLEDEDLEHDIEEAEVDVHAEIDGRPPTDDDDQDLTSLEAIDSNIEREAMADERNALEESLRSKLRAAEISDSVTRHLATQMAEYYLECVQLAKELARLAQAPDGDTATLVSILIDLQYGLDTQMRRVLLEEINTTDLEPTFTLGFDTWSALLISEILERGSQEQG